MFQQRVWTRLLNFISIKRNFNGFLLWVELHVNRANVINTLRSLSWAPVYINAGNIELERGDVIKVNCSRRLSRNLVNPDYFFDISLMKSGIVKENIVIKSYHTLE